jgi:peptide chain release factor 3
VHNNDLIIGAVGPLQFEVAAFRLRDEYGVDCVFEGTNVVAARWVRCEDTKKLEDLKKKLRVNLAEDHTGELVFLAPTLVSLSLTEERWPGVGFHSTREHHFV